MCGGIQKFQVGKIWKIKDKIKGVKPNHFCPTLSGGPQNFLRPDKIKVSNFVCEKLKF